MNLLTPLLLGAIAFPAFAAPATTPATRPTFPDPTTLHTLHLKLSKAAWDDIQPTRKGVFGSLFSTTRPANEEPKHESPFGYQYAFVHAAADLDGTLLNDVGLRFKGNSSYMTGPGVKKPFKLDLDHYAPAATWAGVTTLNLNNNALDPTLMREPLAYEFFRDAGVPAPRTAPALVYLSVDDLHNRDLCGLYTLVEEIDKAFLKSHFGSAKGLLLKPENALNLPYQGDTFDKYERMYRPKSKGPPPPACQRRLVDLVTLIHKADDAAFAKSIATYLDVPAFLRFLAANAAIGNMDSVLSTGHNFYLYIHPDTLQAHFIPWDLNLSFGGFNWVGTLRQQSEISIDQPFVKPFRLAERVLAIPEYSKAYRAEVRRIADTVLTPKRFALRVDAAAATIAKAERQANVPHKPLPPNAPPETDIKLWATLRFDSLEAQFSGKSEGYAPYWQRGFLGGRQQRPATRPTTQNAPTPK